MKKTAICFTEEGMHVIEKLNREADRAGIEKIVAYTDSKDSENEGFIRLDGTLSDWVRDRFEEHSAIIFVGSTGIAVRMIAPFVKDKLSDSPVIVIDDTGRFVIPILSGHVGGANKLALTLAKLLDAIPVITTSTDLHDAFSADVYAKENSLMIRNRDGIKKVNAKAIEGKSVTISFKDYPPKEEVDIIVSDETDREYSLLLSPKPYTIGIGMKKNKDEKEAEESILNELKKMDITTDMIYAVCSIDVKKDEKALKHFCDKYSLPLLVFDSDMLNKLQGEFSSSEFVKEIVGVDNVCERAAVLGAGYKAELVLKKQALSGMTLAVAKRRI